MSKRGDHIHRRQDGRWEGRYPKSRKPGGAILYGSVYGKSYCEVRIKLAEIAVQSIKGNVCINQSKEKTFGELLNLWMENNRLRLKGGTINKYQNLINAQILPDLGWVKLSALTPAFINGFLLRKMQSGRVSGSGTLSAAYIRDMRLIIAAALKFAVAEQLCMPLRGLICKPAENKKDISILSLEEQRKLERHLFLNLDPSKAGILISLHMGLRLGEVCALTWDDVDLGNCILCVRHTIARVPDEDPASKNATHLVLDSPKTKASVRDIPIPSVLLPVFQALKEAALSKYIISADSGFLRPRTLEYRYHRILEKCGIAPISYHALRHTFATRCVEASVDIKTLSEILGHADVRITLNTYVHTSMDRKRKQLEKLKMLSPS